MRAELRLVLIRGLPSKGLSLLFVIAKAQPTLRPKAPNRSCSSLLQRKLPLSEVQMYMSQGSDGGHYVAWHPKGL